MSTDTQTLDTLDLERRVKEMYREVAEEPFKEFHFETGRALAERLGYPGEELDAIPAEAIDSFAGVGYYFELARITPGETVVDLGSGSGTDSFLAARQTGESGRVLGIDMTSAQLAKARRLASEHGIANVEFIEAHIEQLPLPHASADLVISNGVINLAPDKTAVFAEAARVLRPGGRRAHADIVTSTQLPAPCSATTIARRSRPPVSSSTISRRTTGTASSPSAPRTRPRSTASRASRCSRSGANPTTRGDPQWRRRTRSDASGGSASGRPTIVAPSSSRG
jgi:arsenite methyltransferase